MIQTSEKPHVYLWRVDESLTSSEIPMYYLGVNWKLKPYYTHSSESSEEFRSIIPCSKRPIAERKAFFENPPKGISRRILKESDELIEKIAAAEVCKLEHEFLKNRKNRWWDRYYNNSLGDPRYVDQYGENNSQWKGGISLDKKAYRQTPEWKENNGIADRKRNKDPKRVLYKKKQHAELRARRKAETGYAMGFSKAKKKTERHGEGTLKAFI